MVDSFISTYIEIRCDLLLERLRIHSFEGQSDIRPWQESGQLNVDMAQN